MIKPYISPKNKTNAWREQGFRQAAKSGEFGTGLGTFSPGCFMQGHEASAPCIWPHLHLTGSNQTLDSPLCISSDLQHFSGAAWVRDVQNGEKLCNAITALIAPMQFDSGLEAIRLIQEGCQTQQKGWSQVQQWPSVFNGSQLIVNRTTPAHRDGGGCPTYYDLLVSAGNHQRAILSLPELGIGLSYLPGDVVALSGKVLLHQVDGWSGLSSGERVCITHYMKDRVHERLLVRRPAWPELKDYLSLVRK